MVAQAMKTYGLILADNGSPWYVSGAPSPHWSNDQLHALGALHGLRLRGRRHLASCGRSETAKVVPPGPLSTPNVAAHRRRELLDDREPEPAADRPVRADLVVEVEALERVRQVVRGDARAGVGDGESAPARRATVTRPPARRLAERVLDEVRRDLQQAVVVGLDPRLVAGRRAARPRTRAPRPRAGRPPRARPRRGRPARGGPRTRCGSSAPGRAGRGRAARAGRASSTIVRAASSGSNAPSREALGVAADRGQRRLQLVADREQEVALGLTRGARAARPSR